MGEKTKYYFKDIPEEYVKDYEIDAKDIKFTIIFGLILNLVLAIGTIAICLSIKKIGFGDFFGASKTANIKISGIFIFIASMFAYIIMHELTHGLFYKIFTHEKLTYGFTLTVAYCGCPKLYIKKWPMFITSLAPFVVYSILFIVPLFFINDVAIYAAVSFLLGIHIGGCIGDLYCATIMLFKYHKKDVIINDTGPKQTFYIKK